MAEKRGQYIYNDDGTISQLIEVTNNSMEYYGKSTSTKPTGVKVGTTFFAIDTKILYMWDGTTWAVI